MLKIEPTQYESLIYHHNLQMPHNLTLVAKKYYLQECFNGASLASSCLMCLKHSRLSHIFSEGGSVCHCFRR